MQTHAHPIAHIGFPRTGSEILRVKQARHLQLFPIVPLLNRSQPRYPNCVSGNPNNAGVS